MKPLDRVLGYAHALGKVHAVGIALDRHGLELGDSQYTKRKDQVATTSSMSVKPPFLPLDGHEMDVLLIS